jgi:hypothetical protein
MNSTNLCHERFPPFRQATRLYETVLDLARTRHRATNERLVLYAERVLVHAASAGVEASGPARGRTLHYCQIALTKLAALVLAAKCAQLVTDEQAANTREQMLKLEGLISEATSSRSPPVAAGEPSASAADPGPSFIASDGSFSPEELRELRELVERDSRDAPPSHAARAAGGEPES